VVDHFLRLKLRLLANSFRRSPVQVIGMIIAVLYGLGTAVLVIAGLVALRFADVDIARSATVVFGSLVVVAFTVLPLVLGVDDILDPRRFALFGIRTTKLAAGLALAALVSVPALVIIAVALALLATWSRDPLAEGLAAATVIPIVATCVLSSRIATSVGSLVLSSRRARDVAGFIGVLLLIALVPAVAALAAVDWRSEALPALSAIARVLSWTPLGAAWASPADAAAGETSAAVAKLVIALAWMIVLAILWRAIVARTLVTPERQPAARRYAGLGWFDRLPATRIGAIAARNLTYWGRDGRYGTSLAVIPLIPLIMVVALHISGLPWTVLALLPVPVVCLFLSWAIHNDVSFDNTAIWLHLATSTTGRDDRWGRLVPVLLVGVPVIAIGSPLSAWVYGDWDVLPSILGGSSCVLLSGLGLSSIMSAAFPYPTVRPGESPFAQPQGSGSAGGLVQAVSFFAILGVSVPTVLFAILGFTMSPMWHLWSLVAGVGVGVLCLLVGARVGARVYDRRSPDLLAAAIRN
jgi:ABC-2 type transport system permease protein